MSELIDYLIQIQIISEMLQGITIADRGLPILYSQLGYNLGKYVALADQDNVDLWQLLENCVKSYDYSRLIEYTQYKISQQH